MFLIGKYNIWKQPRRWTCCSMANTTAENIHNVFLLFKSKYKIWNNYNVTFLFKSKNIIWKHLMGKLFNPKQVFKSKYILKLFIQDSTHGNKLECSLTALKTNKILCVCGFFFFILFFLIDSKYIINSFHLYCWLDIRIT